jgi:phosphoserine aminotransferase
VRTDGRVINFSAGPGVLPLSVLEQVKADLPTLPGVGASALEVSHRGAWFEGVIEEAEANLRALLKIGDDHRVLFCQGGASMQFAMVPMNLLPDGAAADLVVTGSWGAKAATEAARVGRARVAWTGDAESFVRVPSDEELLGVLDPAAAYAHLTTNETIQGVEFPATPALPDEVVLAADHSSDFLSRPVDVARYGLLYAGAQKNAGPAGVTIVVIRDDVLARIPDGLPTMLDYRTYAENGSMSNTPPVFAIYVVLLVTRWLRDEIGGLDVMAASNRAKADLLYDVIDGHPDVYRGHAEPGSRSVMNVTFRLPTPEDERAFLAAADDEGMVELRGHRSVGGIRASLYNAMPVEGVEALAGLMRRFAER